MVALEVEKQKANRHLARILGPSEVLVRQKSIHDDVGVEMSMSMSRFPEVRLIAAGF